MEGQRRCLNCMREYDAAANQCPYCGYREAPVVSGSYLPPRTVLHQRYLIGRVLRVNSESITYIAYDLKIDATVSVREYLPDTLSRRGEDGQQVMPLPGREAHYKALMSDFSELMLCLTKLRTFHSVVQVYELFRQNGTVYAVCEHIDGIPLSDYLQRRKENLPWSTVKKLILPVLEALAVAHTARVYHRGISPDTVWLNRKGELRLDGFAISPLRAVRTELNAQLYAGYAAPEQYLVSSWHGPWTDVYAVCALIYRMLTGVTPPPAADRVRQDELEPIRKLLPELPAAVAKTVMAGLQVQPENRPQSVRALIDGLAGEGAEMHRPPEKPSHTAVEPAGAEKGKKRSNRRLAAVIAAVSTLAVILVAGVVYYAVFRPDISTMFQFGTGSQEESSAVSENTFSWEAASSEAPSEEASGVIMHSMPNLLGKTPEEIQSNPAYDGLFDITWVTDYNNDFDAGLVCKQSVLFGSRFKPVLKLTLTVSSGSSEVYLPDYRDMDESDYVALLEALGIDGKHYSISYEPSDTVPAGKVIRLDEDSEKLLANESTYDFKGSKVIKIYVSMPE